MRGIVGHAWQILRDTVNERAVRIVPECILVNSFLSLESRSDQGVQQKRRRFPTEGDNVLNSAEGSLHCLHDRTTASNRTLRHSRQHRVIVNTH